MGFLIACPNCGFRNAYEFKFGGEVKNEPGHGAGLRKWRHYFYFNKNVAGVQEEWWYHNPCQTWVLVTRDTATNEVVGSPRLM
ncbi:MAG: sarcosine oxidase subunit delta [Deltaproteobacteria bacterium]|nr:sarcosine oxidase subunit delta [Deltaproteobacteria bacterium]MBW2082545.1 sarcosine oxidase subunit delta [Deltaproteobacteria bacterium]